MMSWKRCLCRLQVSVIFAIMFDCWADALYVNMTQSDDWTVKCTARVECPGAQPGDDQHILGILIFEQVQNVWNKAAYILEDSKTVTVKDAKIAKAEGLVNGRSSQDSYISVSWMKSMPVEPELYQCNVLYIDQESINVAIGKIGSSPDFSSGINCSHDGKDANTSRINRTPFHRPAQREMDHIDQSLSRLAASQQHVNDVITSLATAVKTQQMALNGMIAACNASSSEIRQEFRDGMKTVNDKVDSLVSLAPNYRNTYEWPQGSFALLKASTGCPTNLDKRWTWKEGDRKFHTEIRNNIDEHSSDSHLPMPVTSKEGSRNFVTLHYCSKTDDVKTGIFWPRGSYCVNKIFNCPQGFLAGLIEVNEEDTDYIPPQHRGVLPNSLAGNATYFCCRDDGSADQPIYLPSRAPFYLYQYGSGGCQRVHGMVSAEEFVFMDTDDGELNLKVPPHPDSNEQDKDNVNFKLCYYAPLL